MSKGNGARKIRVLLLENDARSGRLRANNIQSESDEAYTYKVDLARTEAEAMKLIRRVRFEFLLVDFLLKKGTSASLRDTITTADVDDPRNGSKTAKRLLHYHRKVHKEKPSDPHQLRPIVYSGATVPRGEEGEQVRVKILCDGAYEVVSREPEEMHKVLRSLSDMCELQEQMRETIRGENWISKVMRNLGCGISIIGQNWKIWYCSDRNAEYSGLDPNAFHDEVCWREYHKFKGLYRPCPACPATIVMKSPLCAEPDKRSWTCIVDEYPLLPGAEPRVIPHLEPLACSFPQCLGRQCTRKGRPLQSYTNFRLLPVRGGTLKWLHVIASPITSKDGQRVLGAIETVVDMHEQYEGYWNGQLLQGRVTIEQRLKPVLSIVRWLGYHRARVFRLSADEKEIVALADEGDALRFTFPGFRFPATKTLVSKANVREDRDQMVCKGPGFLAHEFGKENCKQFMEFVLREPSTTRNGQIIGTMVVDDVEYAGAHCSRIYGDEDLAKLRPVADYAAQVLALQRTCDHEQALDRHAKALRFLETSVDEYMPGVAGLLPKQQAERLRAFLTEQLAKLLRSEPNLRGFHLRFLHDDGRLYLYPGLGPYSKYAKAQVVEPSDPVSLSAVCLGSRRIEWRDVKEDTCQPFRDFQRQLKKRKARNGKLQEAKAWCRNIRVLGCSPVLWGTTQVGVLAIQSDAADFFSSESLQFIEDVCNFVARILGPIWQDQTYYEFWENAAYAFRGPASKMLDIAERHWIQEQDPKRRKEEEPELAFAEFIFSKADTFRFETGRAGEVKADIGRQEFWPLWSRWCALFRGMSAYGRKRVALALPSDRSAHFLRDLRLQTDGTLLTEIVYNVFENAWKACKRRIRVCVARSEKSFFLRIDDDGSGISDAAYGQMVHERQERPFHEDFEIDSAKGFGLGWKWSKRHADALGVALSPVRIGELGGASVRITIPVLPTS